MVFGAIGLAVGSTMLDVPPGEAFVERSYPPLLVPMPLDWLAAGIMGSAFGFGWAKSFLHHEEAEQPVRRAVRTSSS
jgi:hypothetical protein